MIDPQMDTTDTDLIEIGAQVLEDNEELLTVLDAYGNFEEQSMLVSIGWMIPFTQKTQRSIAEDVITATRPLIEAPLRVEIDHLQDQLSISEGKVFHFEHEVSDLRADIETLRASRERLREAYKALGQMMHDANPDVAQHWKEMDSCLVLPDFDDEVKF